MIASPPLSLRRVAPFLRSVATQVTASVAATLCAAALFGSAPKPAFNPPAANDGKLTARVAAGSAETKTVSLQPQDFAALNSMARFTPVRLDPPAEPAVLAAAAPAPSAPVAKSAPKPRMAVTPPPRPAEIAAAQPSAPAQAAEPEAWRVAGVSIPGSATLRRALPSGTDIVQAGSRFLSAGTEVAQKAGGLLGL